ncbi:MAG: aminotransferase class I and II [Anaerolineales bacterium]|nr:aminotransferase class I and II [Anaerolineales bacterium]
MKELTEIRTITAIRYVTPLREGGSLPAIVEADDQQLYVLKFCGAGQGPKALIAELVAGELARALDLPVPEIVFAHLDPALGRSEPDPEIQDLIKASAGLNLALAYLPGAFAFDPLLNPLGPALASAVVWFDSYVTNVDRTPRNTNILMWQQRPWLIDHGACLYFHHSWNDYLARSRSRFPQIKEHVLLPFADDLPAADAALSARLTPEIIDSVVSLIPAAWLNSEASFADHAEHRAAYAAYLHRRLESPREFVEEAIRARA